MAPGGEMFRYPQHFGENVLPRGSHEWLPYSVDEVRLKSSNTNLSASLPLSAENTAFGPQCHNNCQFGETAAGEFPSYHWVSLVWA